MSAVLAAARAAGAAVLCAVLLALAVASVLWTAYGPQGPWTVVWLVAVFAAVTGTVQGVAALWPWRRPTGPACSDCGDTLTVADFGGRRYCRVDAGRRMAAGEPVDYDQDPADGEAPRIASDCRGSGWYDCPCEADGPDGLCSCCRSGECNGSCDGHREVTWTSTC